MMSETKYWGPIRADIFYNQKKVILTCKRQGPEATRLMPGTMGRVAAWAVDQVAPLELQGYAIDKSGIAEFLGSTT